MKKVGGVVVPLFEVVYRDAIAMYGKYGYDLTQSANYVLYHISFGRPLNYHSVPAHLYWKQSNRTNELPLAADPAGDRALFTRAHRGWAEGLHIMDRFVKNTAEILSPLNEITAQMPLTAHEFLTSERLVQCTVFGTGPLAVEVIVDGGEKEFRVTPRSGGNEVVLPPYGFVVQSPTFVAFNALEYGGLHYGAPTLFTVRALDGKAIPFSARVRVFHAFGDGQIRLGGRSHTVDRESVITQ
jgi:hypothetical protein